VFACGFGAVMAMVFRAVQVKVADPVALVESVAVTLTVVESAVVTVPEMTPVVLLIASPGGSPVAAYVKVAALSESTALIATST